MRILVTGGCGFIGSNFIRYMFQARPGTAIVNLDKLTYAGNPENLRDVEGKYDYTFVRGDICDENLVDHLIGEGFDAVVNFAAESHVDRSIASPREFIHTDVLGPSTCSRPAAGMGRRSSCRCRQTRYTVASRTALSPRSPRSSRTARIRPARRRRTCLSALTTPLTRRLSS